MIQIPTRYDGKTNRVVQEDPINVSISKQEYDAIQNLTDNNFGGYWHYKRIGTKNIESSSLDYVVRLDLSVSGRGAPCFKTGLKGIIDLGKLKELDLKGNKFDDLESVVELLKKLSELQNLNFSVYEDQYDGRFPEELCYLKNLGTLDLSYTGLSSVSRNIYKLTNLQTLGIAHTNVTSLPESILELDSLKHLLTGGIKLDCPSVKLIDELKSRGVEGC